MSLLILVLIALTKYKMMELLFLKICFIAAVSSIFWVEELAEPREGLLKAVHNYYPSVLKKPLNCPVCLSGWVSMAVIVFSAWFPLWVAIIGPPVSFFMTRLIQKIIY